MAEPATDAAAVAPRGRPRDDSRDVAILDAALQLVCEVGYQRVSMDAVAAKAHASKATIYRRWDSKAALVAEAIRARHQHAVTLVDTGDLRGDLLAGVRTMATDMAGDERQLMVGLLTAIHADPELARHLRLQLVCPKEDASRAWTARCIERGLLPPDANLDVFHEVAPAMVFFRLLLSGEPVDEPYLTHVVDDVLLPLLQRPAIPPIASCKETS